MSRILVVLLSLILSAPHSFSQVKSFRQPMTLGIHFLFNDFATATAIRESSLSSVLDEGRFGKLKDMSQGLALSFGKGLTEKFDLYGTLAGSFLSYPIQNNSGSDNLLLESDVSIRGKMFSDKYFLVPYVQLGAGISKYKGYWGTFIPIGVGLQLNFFNEAFLQINSQYRVGVTENTRYHFVHSIGLIGNIGRRVP